jgi:hypothetical protein
VKVSDPESEHEFPHKKLRAKFLHSPDGPTQLKHHSVSELSGSKAKSAKVHKIDGYATSRALAAPVTNTPSMYEVSAPSNEVTAGCTWSETDWSCAYNTVFMVLFYIYCSSDFQW